MEILTGDNKLLTGTALMLMVPEDFVVGLIWVRLNGIF